MSTSTKQGASGESDRAGAHDPAWAGEGCGCHDRGKVQGARATALPGGHAPAAQQGHRHGHKVCVRPCARSALCCDHIESIRLSQPPSALYGMLAFSPHGMLTTCMPSPPMLLDDVLYHFRKVLADLMRNLVRRMDIPGGLPVRVRCRACLKTTDVKEPVCNGQVDVFSTFRGSRLPLRSLYHVLTKTESQMS